MVYGASRGEVFEFHVGFSFARIIPYQCRFALFDEHIHEEMPFEISCNASVDSHRTYFCIVVQTEKIILGSSDSGVCWHPGGFDGQKPVATMSKCPIFNSSAGNPHIITYSFSYLYTN